MHSFFTNGPKVFLKRNDAAFSVKKVSIILQLNITHGNVMFIRS